MVVCHLHIISLKAGVSVAGFLAKLGQHGIKPVFQARVLRWMILPTEMSAGHLLARNTHWDLFLGLESGVLLPASTHADVAAIWSASCGVGTKALAGYSSLNTTLLNQPRKSITLAGVPGQGTYGDAPRPGNLELSPEWVQWIDSLPADVREHPVSMLNLLAFNPGKIDQYKQYGVKFAKRVGSRHGGRVKILGRVVDSQAKDDGWDEFAYVHYPTINHFASMAGSKDYQEVNQQYRLGALKDTFILCCQEINDRGELAAPRLGTSKL